MKPWYRFGCGALLGAALCLGLSGAAAENFTDIDVFYSNGQDQFLHQVSAHLDSIAAEKGITLHKYDASADYIVQLRQIEMIENNARPKIVNLVDTQSASQFLDIARRRGTRVIFFDGPPPRRLLNEYDRSWYIGSNPMEAGVLQGQLVVDYLKEHPEIDRNCNGFVDVVFLTLKNNSEEARLCTTNLVNTLRQNDVQFQRLDTVKTEISFEGAYNGMSLTLSRFGIDNVDLVVSVSDTMALGAIAALNQYGFNLGNGDRDHYIPVFGVDAIPGALDAMREGKLEGTVLNDARAVADALLQLAGTGITDTRALRKRFKLNIGNDGFVFIPYRKIDRAALRQMDEEALAEAENQDLAVNPAK